MGDFALIWDGSDADLAILDDDLESEEGLRTAVLLSLFTDRRALDDDPLPGDDDDRRGWWGDAFLEDPNDRFGSRRWLLARTKITRDLLPRIEAYDREALQWMLADRVCSRIDTEYEIQGQQLRERITLHRPGKDPLSLQFAHAWDGEASRPSVLVLPDPNRAPTAGFTVEVDGLFATVTDASSDPDGDDTIASRSMDWGDDSVETLAGAGPWDHEYASVATFSATLTVTDDGGLSGEFIDDIVIEILLPDDDTEWDAAYPSLSTPTALWAMQAESTPVPDGVGSNDLAAVGTPVFGAEGEGGRLAVSFDSTNDGLACTDTAAFNLDGATDLTLLLRATIPETVGSSQIVMSKRSTAGDRPGYNIYILTTGYLQLQVDPGAGTVLTATLEEDHRGAIHDIALVFDETSNLARIETLLGTATLDITAIGDATSPAAFAYGSGYAGGLGMSVHYGAAWEGLALTREELLTFWSGL